MEGFINKVQESGLITLDLTQYYPEEPIVLFDIKPHLFMELILKEKEWKISDIVPTSFLKSEKNLQVN